ncbi:MAG: UPF0182 family protein [Gemmatimonadales bacterium]
MSRRSLALLTVAAVLVLLFGGRWVALRYTEHAWFADLEQGARYRALMLRAFLWQASVFAAAFLWYAAHTLGLYRSIGSVHLPRRLGNLEIDEAVPARTLRGIAIGIAVLLAVATAYTFNDLGDYVALARVAPPLGVTENVLGQDASFYLATLPLLEILHLLATVSVLLACLLVVGLYMLTGSFTVSRKSVRITPHARTHLIILMCALALVLSWGFHLDTYEVVGGAGHLGGALSGVDRTIRIPASGALAVIALAVAAGTALANRWVRPGILVIIWGTLVVAALLGRLVIPLLAEAWGAGSNPALQQELQRGADEAARAAFGLGNPAVDHVSGGPVASDSDAALEEALAGVYAWGAGSGIAGRLLEAAAGDTARIRAWSITPVIARVSGRPRPAVLAIAQTDVAAIPRQAPRPRWSQWHRETLAWGSEPVAVEAGLKPGPLRFLTALDPSDTGAPMAALRHSAGRVRFLPGPAELGVVGPDENTFGADAPGVLLSGWPRRLLLAWALQSPPLLDEHTSIADRVLYWRDVPDRLARLYPFAGFDPPRAMLLDGRLVWIADGYLTSSRYPLAEHVRWRGDDVNYIESPYVATVDAFDGQTELFLRPGASAFALGVARASALVPLPADSMPLELRRELAYPRGLLGAQAAMFARHAPGAAPGLALATTDSAAMRDASLLEPTVALLALGSTSVRQWQLLPFTDVRGTRLAALLAASALESGRLELRIVVPQGPLALTPAEAGARMSATPAAVASAAFAGPAGPARGKVLVVPAAGSIVYAQALYATADRQRDPPRMAGIILLAGDRVAVGADLPAAVRSLQRGDAGSTRLPLNTEELAAARAAFLSLDSASKAGDWDRFARSWGRLRRALGLDSGRGARP